MPISLTLLMSGLGAMVWACDGTSADTDTGDTDENKDSDTSTEARTVFLAEENNYSYESALHIPRVETAASADIEICWDDLTRDIQCHEIDPAEDIDNITLVRIRNMTEEEVETALSQDDLKQSNVDGYLAHGTEELSSTCVTLADFTFLGSDVNVEEEYVVSDVNKYLLVLTTGTVPGVGAKMMTFMTPSEASSNTSVEIGEGCDVLDFSADLSSLTPTAVPTDEPVILDWSDIAPPGITRAMLGFYEGMTVSEMEENVLDLMSLADKKWETDIESGASVALNDMVDDNNDAFEQFEGDGSWLFLLLCDGCQNPAPPFLTLLDPSKGETK